MSEESDATPELRERVLTGLLAFASAQNELGREFARGIQMHTTDSVAIVAIINAEERGRPLTPVRLAELVGLSTGATSILLNRLENAGHVTRVRGHADRRMVTLHSTAAVHETADAFFKPLGDRFHTMLGNYSAGELLTVEKLVADLRSTMDLYLENPGGNDAPGREA